MSSFDYINKTYGTKFKRGTRIEYAGGARPRRGRIVSTTGSYINVRFDDDPYRTDGPFHPTGEIRCLDTDPKP